MSGAQGFCKSIFYFKVDHLRKTSTRLKKKRKGSTYNQFGVDFLPLHLALARASLGSTYFGRADIRPPPVKCGGKPGEKNTEGNRELEYGVKPGAEIGVKPGAGIRRETGREAMGQGHGQGHGPWPRPRALG